MKKLRILACAFTCCPPGQPGFTGGEDLLGWNIIKQISKYHETWILTQGEDRASIEDTCKKEPNSNLHFLYVDLPRWLRFMLKIQGGHQIYYYFWQLKSYFTAKKLHKQEKFDLFHHITYANDWMASFVGALLPVPYVRGPGGGAHSTPEGFQKEYSLSGRFWEKMRAPGQWMFRRDPFFVKGQQRASAILVCNHEAQDHLPADWASKSQLFPVSGISSEDLAIYKDRSSDPNVFRVLSAGSLIRVKGFGLTVKSFKSFSDRHPKAKLTIVGTGPEETRLKLTVRQLGIEEKVDFIGWLSREELLKKMAECDVFLFPSLRDGGGTVVIEAMSMATPVIGLENGGPGLHITEETGIKINPTYPQKTVSDLAEALERLYADEGLRHKMGDMGRVRAETMYHWDRLGERLRDIYLQAVPKGTLQNSK